MSVKKVVYLTSVSILTLGLASAAANAEPTWAETPLAPVQSAPANVSETAGHKITQTSEIPTEDELPQEIASQELPQALPLKSTEEVLSLQNEVDEKINAQFAAKQTLRQQEIDTTAVTASTGNDETLETVEKTALQTTPVEAATATPAPLQTPALEETETANVAVDELERLDEESLPSPVIAELQKRSENQVIASKFLSKEVRGEVRAFYEARDFEPLWVEDGKVKRVALSLLSRIGDADSDGLNAKDYQKPSDILLKANELTPAQAADLEIQISEIIVQYARDAQAGRIAPRKVSRNLDRGRTFPKTASILNELNAVTDKVTRLEQFNPQHPQFLALKAELNRLQAETFEKEQIVQVPAGKTLKIGQKGVRVALLRQRLNVEVINDTSSEVFDESLQEAVRSYQKENGLSADGIVGPQTLAQLNGEAGDRTDDLIANMEQWRWMPRNMGRVHVHVNIPSYKLDINRNGESFHTTRVVVGKPKHATPVFSDEMEHIVVNPYWNVPYSIASKELLPRAQSSGGSYLSNRNYEVLAKVKGRYRAVSPSSVNWSALSTRNMRGVRLRQRPGGRNALGNVKFLFPNKHAVYLHDTPSKSLFERVSRAYSHGCVRVHNPLQFADALLTAEPKFSGETIRRRVGGKKENWYNLTNHIPVHITYFTVVADDNGSLTYKPDIYGYQSKIKRALGLI